ncbi:MAG: extensin [Polaromonas sp.]|nr:extensin [Polaromonas sp.]
MPPPDAHRSPTTAPPKPGIRWGRALGLLVWFALVAGVYAVYIGAVQVPDRFNPWAPLDVAAEPNALTPYKLSRARAGPAQCLAALSQAGMAYDVLPDRITGPGCGFDNAVRVRQARVRLGSTLPLSCPLALSFAMWERHALQPAAQGHFGQRVAAIDTLGSYACRNINTGEGSAPHAPAGRRSRHATADALDVAGFTLANGRRISVQRDYRRKDATNPPGSEALFLDDLHAGACRYFQGVLGPDYNAVHHDHFHLETGGYRMCR